MENILFIDRDGTLVQEPFDNQVDDLNKIQLCIGVIPALLKLINAGYKLVMVSNQDGLGTASFPWANFQRCHDFILNLFSSQGIVFDEIFICPHRSDDYCTCRKPKTGLLDSFIKQHTLNYKKCWVIGDRESDKELAHNLGIAFLPVAANHNWEQIAQEILGETRHASIKRQTKETTIELAITLDSAEPSQIYTPIGFFSHMLEQVAKHGGFSMQLNATGDIDVDDHHLIEDTALALGEAIKQALGNKWGIERFGYMLPMDESLASVAIDLCGRSFCQFDGQFKREFVGGLATEMVPHFFRSFASSLNATLHVQIQGDNHHHMIEACFKALGRSLRQAMLITRNDLPSTKGVL